MTIPQELSQMASRLRELFPESRSIMLTTSVYGGVTDVELTLHRMEPKGESAVFARLGVDTIKAFPINDEKYTVEGHVDGVDVCCFCREEVVPA